MILWFGKGLHIGLVGTLQDLQKKQRDDFRLLKAIAMGLHLQSVKLFAIILILARIELIFFVVAHMVLWF